MVHAARGTRDLDEGTEPVEAPEERARLRAQARGVWVRAAVVAAVGTAVLYALPL